MRIERGALAAFACVLAAAAQAEGSPYSIGAGVSFGSDDNLFRSPPGETVSDQYRTASLSAGVDQTISRQRLQASATLRRSHYQERSDLDNTGYGLQLGWNGSTAGAVSWSVSYGANRSLASYTSIVEPELRVANIETSRQASASAQLGLAARWVASLTLSHRSLDYSAPAYAGDQYRLDSVGVGAQWHPLGPLSATLGPRFTRGRIPQARVAAGGGFDADGFDRRDIDLSLNWVASGASTLTARLSLTSQTYDLLSDRNFDGATGQLAWAWAATGKTRTNLAISRDTGSETSFFTLSLLGQPQRGTGDNSQLTTSLSARIDHDLTGKIATSLGVQYARRRLAASSRAGSGAGVELSNEAGDERSGSVTLGLRYEPTRNSVVGCDIAQFRRAAGTTLSSPYRANTLSCSGQLTLR